MIGPVYEFADLFVGTGLDGATREPPPPGLPSREQMDRRADQVAELLGIRLQQQSATGLFLVAPMPDGTRRNLLRVSRYVLARPDEILDAVSAIVIAAARDHGVGRVWCLNGPAHIVRDDDGTVRVAYIRSERHVVVRSWICHENGPQYEERAS